MTEYDALLVDHDGVLATVTDRATLRGAARDALEDAGLPAGVVSNNQARIVEFVLGEHGLAGWFDTVRARAPTVESLAERKPDPGLLEVAMADLGSSDPLFVGDSESDVRAAARAGVDVAYPGGHTPDRSAASSCASLATPG